MPSFFSHHRFLFDNDNIWPSTFSLFLTQELSSMLFQSYQNASLLPQPIVFVSDRAKANKEIEHSGIRGEKKKKKVCWRLTDGISPRVEEDWSVCWWFADGVPVKRTKVCINVSLETQTRKIMLQLTLSPSVTDSPVWPFTPSQFLQTDDAEIQSSPCSLEFKPSLGWMTCGHESQPQGANLHLLCMWSSFYTVHI